MVSGERYAVPHWAEALLAVAVHDRRRDGARARDPLFVDRSGQRAMDARTATALLAGVRERTGIRFDHPSRLSQLVPPTGWLRLEALRLVEIGETPQRVSSWFPFD